MRAAEAPGEWKSTIIRPFSEYDVQAYVIHGIQSTVFLLSILARKSLTQITSSSLNILIVGCVLQIWC